VRKFLALGFVFLILPQFAVAQTQQAKLTIRVILVDGALNQKPSPRLELVLTPVGRKNAEPITARTGFDGLAKLQLFPGGIPGFHPAAR
jgi:hypothetical protein